MTLPDQFGGSVKIFRYGRDKIAYHVEGEGRPVLMTMGISAAGGSYDWRYIFECLAGAFRVYALDVLGMESQRHSQRHSLPHGSSYYQKLVEEFLAKVIEGRASVISGPVEAPFALKASFERPRLVDKLLIVSPDGARRIATHNTIGRSVLYRILRLPKLESVMYGSTVSKRSMLVFLRSIRRPGKEPRPLVKSRLRLKYPPLSLLSERRFVESAWGTSLMQAPVGLSRMVRKSRRIVGELDEFRILRHSRLIVFQRSGELPMRKDALRFCDDAIKFLG
jgi:pimeloyl-ACP methyl ester carboxylesterase